MAEPVLSLRGVSKRYGEVHVLRGADLDVRAGELVVVRGASGSGKSTLLHLAGLMDAPDAGTVAHRGRDLSREPEEAKAKERLAGLGFVFQRCYLVPTLTAAANVSLPLKAANAEEPEKRAHQLLERVGLRGRETHYPHELSGGQQQLVAVARALANKPYLVLADEPTGELDPDSAARVMDMLGRAAREHGAAVVLVTHAPERAPSPARHLALRGGKLEVVA